MLNEPALFFIYTLYLVIDQVKPSKTTINIKCVSGVNVEQPIVSSKKSHAKLFYAILFKQVHVFIMHNCKKD